MGTPITEDCCSAGTDAFNVRAWGNVNRFEIEANPILDHGNDQEVYQLPVVDGSFYPFTLSGSPDTVFAPMEIWDAYQANVTSAKIHSSGDLIVGGNGLRSTQNDTTHALLGPSRTVRRFEQTTQDLVSENSDDETVYGGSVVARDGHSYLLQSNGSGTKTWRAYDPDQSGVTFPSITTSLTGLVESTAFSDKVVYWDGSGTVAVFSPPSGVDWSVDISPEIPDFCSITDSGNVFAITHNGADYSVAYIDSSGIVSSMFLYTYSTGVDILSGIVRGTTIAAIPGEICLIASKFGAAKYAGSVDSTMASVDTYTYDDCVFPLYFVSDENGDIYGPVDGVFGATCVQRNSAFDVTIPANYYLTSKIANLGKRSVFCYDGNLIVYGGRSKGWFNGEQL